MTTVSNGENTTKETDSIVGKSIALGLVLGMALGAASSNIALGMLLGMGIGAAYGAALDRNRNKKQGGDTSGTDI